MRYLLKVFQFEPLNQNQPIEIDVQDIDHLGLIAGIVDEIGIVEIINRLLGNHPLEEISAGYVVKALILNCLGFLTAPLYLFSQFFVGKATEHLIGPDVKPEQLNDSRIGRVLDQLYKKGLTSVFVEIALAAVKRFGVSIKQVHLDGSSICVQGEYINNQPERNLGEIEPKVQSDGAISVNSSVTLTGEFASAGWWCKASRADKLI